MLAALEAGDTVVMVELSRLGRSTKDLLSLVDIIHAKGAHFKSLSEAWLDTTSPWGQLIFTIFAALSHPRPRSANYVPPPCFVEVLPIAARLFTSGLSYHRFIALARRKLD